MGIPDLRLRFRSTIKWIWNDLTPDRNVGKPEFKSLPWFFLSCCISSCLPIFRTRTVNISWPPPPSSQPPPTPHTHLPPCTMTLEKVCDRKTCFCTSTPTHPPTFSSVWSLLIKIYCPFFLIPFFPQKMVEGAHTKVERGRIAENENIRISTSLMSYPERKKTLFRVLGARSQKMRIATFFRARWRTANLQL